MCPVLFTIFTVNTSTLQRNIIRNRSTQRKRHFWCAAAPPGWCWLPYYIQLSRQYIEPWNYITKLRDKQHRVQRSPLEVATVWRHRWRSLQLNHSEQALQLIEPPRPSSATYDVVPMLLRKVARASYIDSRGYTRRSSLATFTRLTALAKYRRVATAKLMSHTSL